MTRFSAETQDARISCGNACCTLATWPRGAWRERTLNDISFDNALLADVMYDYLDQTLPEPKLDEMVQACSK
jgi:hypothetical protein